MRKFLASIIFSLGIVSISRAATPDNAILVTQPAYHSMSFYVHKPVNVPRDFYVTYDGYLVYKDEKGIWHYGTADGNTVTKTGYVVGSVIPSVVKLRPYDTHISSVAPILGTDRANPSPSTTRPGVSTPSPSQAMPGTVQAIPSSSAVTPARSTPASVISAMPGTNIASSSELKSPRIIYMPPLSPFSSSGSPNATDWTQNSNFMAVGKWQKSIDRIGVLNRPAMPVAWKGDNPEVVYAWTGLQWQQLNAQSRGGSYPSALSTIRRGIYDLVVKSNKVNVLHWTDDDSHVLSQYAVMWGYEWLGQIITGKVY